METIIKNTFVGPKLVATEYEVAILTDLRISSRSTTGWQGSQGVAMILTAHCSCCNRRVQLRSGLSGYSHTVEKFDRDAQKYERHTANYELSENESKALSAEYWCARN